MCISHKKPPEQAAFSMQTENENVCGRKKRMEITGFGIDFFYAL